MRIPQIAIMTDFGLGDPFVGIMKGVIAGINPDARTVDLTHLIPPGDVRRAAVQLWQAVPFFPAGTIFLVVVDPGVGTRRRGMLAHAGDHFLIGPDNGVFTFILGESQQVWALDDRRFQLGGPSATFHGRDIFAPAAAYCSLGYALDEFGPRINNPVRLPDPRLRFFGTGRIEGEVLFADHFGNLLTSLGRFTRGENSEGEADFLPWLPASGISNQKVDLARATLSRVTGQTLRFARTFSEVPKGECAAIIGSSGLVEIVANGVSAADILQLGHGAPVSLAWIRHSE